MKGFTQKEIELLIDEAMRAGKYGDSLSRAFEKVASKTGRAKGSVRNFYYNLMKDTEVGHNKKLIEKSGLKVEKNVGFSREEENELVKNVLLGVKQGKSVRRAIIDLSQGNDKLELRIQNKYRNMVKNSPMTVEKIAKEIGLYRNGNKKSENFNKNLSVYVKKVSTEIDKLVERLKNKYGEENKLLSGENKKLKAENEELKAILNASKISVFFDGKNKKSQ